MRFVDRENAEHYHWKTVCDGWHLLKTEECSVIAEKMPPQTAEDMHYHCRARQFFYILSGEVEMRSTNGALRLVAGSGVEVEPTEPHQMVNPSSEPAEFIVISIPKSHGDRVLVTE